MVVFSCIFDWLVGCLVLLVGWLLVGWLVVLLVGWLVLLVGCWVCICWLICFCRLVGSFCWLVGWLIDWLISAIRLIY